MARKKRKNRSPVYECVECGHNFTPRGDVRDCPECGGSKSDLIGYDDDDEDLDDLPISDDEDALSDIEVDDEEFDEEDEDDGFEDDDDEVFESRPQRRGRDRDDDNW